MLTEEVKFNLIEAIQDNRSSYIILNIPPSSIVEYMVNELPKKAPVDLREEIILQVKNIEENRSEAEKLVAGILGYM